MSHWICFCFQFWDWTQGFVLIGQVLYSVSYVPRPFVFYFVFWVRISITLCRWALNVWSFSISWVAGIQVCATMPSSDSCEIFFYIFTNFYIFLVELLGLLVKFTYFQQIWLDRSGIEMWGCKFLMSTLVISPQILICNIFIIIHF
jgi:hypothetical protein